jgi:hypothetical protein
MSTKWFLSLLLGLACTPALAEWVRVSSSEESTFYIESPTAPKAGGYVMIWVLRDHQQLQHGSVPHLSSKDQIEVDCDKRRIRKVFSSDHPQPMGQGQAVHFAYGPMSWNYAAPRTIVERIVNIACAAP